MPAQAEARLIAGYCGGSKLDEALADWAEAMATRQKRTMPLVRA
jgi:hypothetical protein